MADPKNKTNSGENDLLYMPPPRTDFSGYREEGFQEKFMRKTGENPFVPLGLAATTVILSYGLWQMRTGNKARSQMMMRARIVAQGLTIGAVLVGVVYGAGKK